MVSCLYQSEERKILDVIVSEINEIAREKYVDEPIGSLIHDGLHVKKDLKVSDHISRMEERINFDTGYEIKLAVKPMEQTDLSAWGNEL